MKFECICLSILIIQNAQRVNPESMLTWHNKYLSIERKQGKVIAKAIAKLSFHFDVSSVRSVDKNDDGSNLTNGSLTK